MEMASFIYIVQLMAIPQHTKVMRMVLGREEDILGAVSKNEAFFGQHTQGQGLPWRGCVKHMMHGWGLSVE